MVHLDHRDAQPIYSQIVASIRNQITAGVLQSGDKLPSVRDLASELAINPNTIQKSYAELIRRGIIQSAHGSGCFVAPGAAEILRREATARLDQLRDLVRELRLAGLDAEDIVGAARDAAYQTEQPTQGGELL